MPKLKLNTIHNLDCVAGMHELPEGSVDLAFADPPFNIGYDYDVYNDRKEREHYLDWSKQWIAGVHRVLNPTGTFWLAIGDEYAAELKIISQDAGFICRSWVIWYYTFGVNCKKKFSRSHVHLFHFVKHAKKFTFNFADRAVRVPSARQLVYADDRADPNGRLPDDTWILRPQDLPEGFREDGDMWFFSRVAGTFKERAGFHGCQMPEQLLGRIIRVSSNAGDTPDLVLDPFSGSATTLVVAKKLGRNFVGFDLSKEYVKSGLARLNSVNSGDPLEGPEEPLLSAPPTPGRATSRNSKAAIPRPVVQGSQRKDVQESPLTLTEGVKAAIVEAYRASCDGFSVDRVLADDPLRAAFAERCTKLGVEGTATQWNRALFRLRKAGRLSGVPTKRRTDVDWNAAERYVFASEIALRTTSDEGYSIDAVLCDAALLKKFDETAASFAPGFSPFEYRWAALMIRKAASDYLESPTNFQIKSFSRRQSVFDVKLALLRRTPGLYLLTAEDRTDRVFAGITLDLAGRIENLIDGSQLRDAWANRTTAAFVQFVNIDPHRDIWKKGGFGQQGQLVMKFRPRLNFVISRTADATRLAP